MQTTGECIAKFGLALYNNWWMARVVDGWEVIIVVAGCFSLFLFPSHRQTQTPEILEHMRHLTRYFWSGPAIFANFVLWWVVKVLSILWCGKVLLRFPRQGSALARRVGTWVSIQWQQLMFFELWVTILLEYSLETNSYLWTQLQMQCVLDVDIQVLVMSPVRQYEQPSPSYLWTSSSLKFESASLFLTQLNKIGNKGVDTVGAQDTYRN